MRWRILLLMMVFVALAQFNRYTIMVAGTEQLIREDYISETKMGLVYSAFLLLYTLFMMPGGWFIDRFGPRAAWLELGFGSVVFVALTGLTGRLWTDPVALWVALLVVRALLGAVNAPLHPTGARLVSNWIPPSGASTANGLVIGAAGAGIALAPVLFGPLIDRFGWPDAFQITAAVTLVVTLLWALWGRDKPPGTTELRPARRARSLTPGQFVLLLKNRSLLYLTASYALVGYFEYLFFWWAKYYFENKLALPKETGRLYTTILNLAIVPGMVLGGWFSDRALSRLGLRRGLAFIPIYGLLLSSLAVILGLLAPTPKTILVCFAVAMAAVGASEGSFWTTAVYIGGSRGGTAAGILNTGGNAGGLLAPVLTPVISAALGWQVGFGMAAVVCLGGAGLWLYIDPAERLEQEED
ncbi:MAG: MFS transporter [Planctomycetes bacterium]|nr:MFS transporter [Planctomycetota bacterium]